MPLMLQPVSSLLILCI